MRKRNGDLAKIILEKVKTLEPGKAVRAPLDAALRTRVNVLAKKLKIEIETHTNKDGYFYVSRKGDLGNAESIVVVDAHVCRCNLERVHNNKRARLNLSSVCRVKREAGRVEVMGLFRCKWCKKVFQDKNEAEQHGVTCGMEFDLNN